MYLKNYAKIIVNIGIAVEKGDLVKVNFSPDHLPLVREIVKEAYKKGAQYVALDIRDSEIEKARVHYLEDAYLNVFPESVVSNEMNYATSGYSNITIVAPRFSEENADWTKRASLINKAKLNAMRECRAYGMSNHNKWVVINAPTKEWATQVFPECSEDEAVELLWKHIFKATKSTALDPVLEWKIHDKQLKKITQKLNKYQFSALRFKNKQTDLEVGLVKNHVWLGGLETTRAGKEFMSNIPVEEVWTMPNKHLVNGYVTITKPIVLAGQTILELKLEFEKGRVINIEPKNQVIEDFLQTDEGAGLLGEIALVPIDSSIAETGITFKSILFDENAASHMAFGQAYIDTLQDGFNKSEEELQEIEMNHSSVHEDIMIGDDEMDVYGLLGTEEVLVMEKGKWKI